MSEYDLAERIGVSRSAVQQWERGTTFPKRSHHARTAAVLGVSVVELMGYAPNDTPPTHTLHEPPPPPYALHTRHELSPSDWDAWQNLLWLADDEFEAAVAKGRAARQKAEARFREDNRKKTE